MSGIAKKRGSRRRGSRRRGSRSLRLSRTLRRALSLVEVLVVIIITTLSLPIAFFSLQSAYQEYREKQVIERVKSAYHSAVWLAELFNNEVQLVLTENERGQSLMLQSAAFTSGSLRQHFQRPIMLPSQALFRFENGGNFLSFFPGEYKSTTPDFILNGKQIAVSTTSRILLHHAAISQVTMPEELQQMLHLPTS